jgi:hypothetical protein
VTNVLQDVAWLLFILKGRYTATYRWLPDVGELFSQERERAVDQRDKLVHPYAHVWFPSTDDSGE